jgi:hypothetical protein
MKRVNFILIKETITIEKCEYKGSKVQVLEYKILKEFITNNYKLFTSKD